MYNILKLYYIQVKNFNKDFKYKSNKEKLKTTEKLIEDCKNVKLKKLN